MPAPRAGDAHRGQLFPAPRHRDQITATMTTNPPPDARNARIYVATANVAVMDILSGREHRGTRSPISPLTAGRHWLCWVVMS